MARFLYGLRAQGRAFASVEAKPHFEQPVRHGGLPGVHGFPTKIIVG